MTNKKKNNPTFSYKFWENKPLEKLNFKEWEALCDGCGKCCLNKIEDEETGQVFLTRIACRLFNDESCLCSNYKKRHKHVPECIKLTPSTIKQNAYWLPSTCAYKLIYEKKPLPAWHPLLTGQKETTHDSGISVRGSTISEKSVNEEDWENYIITDPK